MTDAIISVVVAQLATFVQQEVKPVVCVREYVNALNSTLQTLQAVLRDAETRQIKEEAIRLWLDKLKAIAYDAEDVLDEWNTRNHYSLIQGVSDDVVRLHKKVCSYFLSPCFTIRSIVVRYFIGRRIKKIRKRLDDVANEKEKFKLNHSQIHVERRDPLTSSIIDVSNIYGRDHDKNIILSWLLGESSAHVMNTNVISIVGTGGFGKTTLANLVLDDGDVKKTFEKRIFVCVSDPFNLFKVAKSIIEQVTGNSPSVEERESLLKCLCETLKGKRFLIVLDDVWTEDPNDWIPLKVACDGGAQGSWVIVTTRSKKVAELMHSKHTHNMAELSEPDSWLLFEHIAFAGRKEELLKFEEIGKKIVVKCKGVPLSIKIVGSLMRSMKTNNEWNHVLTSEIWEIEKIVKEISPSLFLSYNPLTSNLKQCFMYCAIFPKDTQLYKNDLVKLWMAQGFLGSGGNRNLEKIGCDYFDDLAMHSFFQDFEKSPDGNITSCKMHDLVHDFALFLTQGECSFLEDGRQLDGINVRHLITESLESSSIYMAKNLRTLISESSSDFDELIKVFNQLKSIRTFITACPKIFPRQIKKLLHLRYLDLSGSEFEELPETICKLYNLQTLKLKECEELIQLPAKIGNLLNLRHLELEGTNALNCIPRGIGKLKYLRTLSKFIVGNANNECKISELKDLCYLQGSLMIIGLERVADGSEAAQAELKNKSVVALELVFESPPKEGESERLEEEESDSGRIEKDNGILENLQPHENVEQLDISGFKGSQFSSWIPNRSMLANLLKLTLRECIFIKKLPALGNLTSLENLQIKGMHSLEHIGDEFYSSGVVAFPKLRKLVIDDMNQLVELSFARDNKKIMPCLSELQVSNCPKLTTLIGLGTLESLKSLTIMYMPAGLEFWGVSAADDEEERKSSEEELGGILRALPDVAQFKSLEILRFKYVDSQLQLLEREKGISFPCLRELTLRGCTSLRMIPGYLFPHTLRELVIAECPELRGVQPCLPPLLESLHLEGDVGVFSESLPIAEEEEENNNNYPNLKNLQIRSSKYPSLPKGFNHLTAIQYLEFVYCESLDFDLNELKHLTMLQKLEIYKCPILAFQTSGDDWMTILSHVPKIYIDWKNIRESN